MQIGIEKNHGDGLVSTSIATVTHKDEESDEIVACPGFTEDDAVLVKDCIDELEFAQAFGQISDISFDLSKIVEIGDDRVE